MTTANWVAIHEVYGEIQAEMLRGLLEAQGIPTFLNQEAAGRVYGLNVGSLGRIQILVSSDASENARQVLADYYAGKFAGEEDAPPEV